MRPARSIATSPARQSILRSACLALALASAAGAQTLDPYRASSRSGAWTLAVDPSEPTGSGPGAHTLRHEDELAWSRVLPFTFWLAAVADDGSVAGVAYPRGLRGYAPIGDHSVVDELLVVFLDADGSLRAEERLARHDPWICSGLPVPLAQESFLQPELDRFVVRLHDEDAYSGGERWRVYRASNGEFLIEARPRSRQPRSDALALPIAVRPVEGTPLVAVHWDGAPVASAPDRPRIERFALLDEDFRPVWSLDLVEPRPGPSTPERERTLDDARWEGESLGGAWSPRHFALQLLRESVAVRFEVAGDAREGFTARELERVPVRTVVDEAVERNAFEPIDLPQFEPVPLGDPDLDPAFVFVDGLGRILVQDGRDTRIHAFDARGIPLFVSEHAPSIANARDAHAAALADGSLLFELGRGDHLHLAADGTRLGRPVFEGHALAIRPGTNERWVLRDDALVRLEGSGGEGHRTRKRADGGWFAWPRDLAIAPDGELAVLSSPLPQERGALRVSLFGPTGEPRATIEAPKSLFECIAAGRGWVALDLASDVGLLVCKRDGARFRSDREPGMLKRSFVSPDGRELWRFRREPLRLVRYALPP